MTRQSLACIRCGACLNACPVYQQVGGHAYGSVYPGPIGAVITPQLIGLSKAKQLPYASSLCGACREVCPVKIDIPELLLHLRAEITDGTAGGTMESVEPKPKFVESLAFRMYGFAWSKPGWYELGTKSLEVNAKVRRSRRQNRKGERPDLATRSAARCMDSMARCAGCGTEVVSGNVARQKKK